MNEAKQSEARSERFRLFVASAPGLEPLLTTELEGLGVEEAAAVAGGVSCFGDRETIYRLNLGCGLGLRVLVHVAEFIVRDFRKLERVAAALDWERWLAPERGVRVRAHAKRSRLYHTTGIVERIERGITMRTKGKVRLRVDEARGPGGGELGEGSAEPTLIQVRLVRDRCTISVDTTGTLLHKRGWRQETGKAPLREDIARALILLAGWRPGVALLDPMTGSGTFPIEAATIAAGLPPGHARRFSCMDNPEFDARLFERAKAALLRPASVGASVIGCERDVGALEAARANAARAGVGEGVSFIERSLGDAEIPSLVGDGTVLICNPPWGQRTGDPARLRNLYASIGNLAEQLPRPVRVGLVTNDNTLAHATRLPLTRVVTTDHGGIKVGLWVGGVD
jgi:putative N6-adenine-specific DNA methylase